MHRTCCPRRAAATAWGTARCSTTCSIDGLQNPYDGALMGHFADATARKYDFSRARSRTPIAAESVRRALAACESGAFGDELVAVTVKTRKGEQVVRSRRAAVRLRHQQDPAAQAGLRQGRHGDGGQLVLDRRRRGGAGADGRGGDARGRCERRWHAWSAYASHAQAPEWFTTAPAGAIQRVLQAAGWQAPGRGSVRDQRGVCGRHDGGHERSRPGAREGQRQRRRLRARASDRRLRRAHPRDAAACAARRASSSAASPRCASAAAKPPRSPSKRSRYLRLTPSGRV